ncbi:hypothetical protein A2903_00935 [Candidatus Nomurabacteria bacterium RIFCSPLOWO2_01_FULL_33_17]|uniref:Uncharacterized protein n=1 Tax=Candidatus Nomurabacteria bacterium RIFCSPLOWO2_01_FULL_33_17 TaxID=1801764 RepID=A0A1F6WPR6_9BACT|nr:MAG: hypothetical protein A2903_00935 [Candidatus Nomurabacteria bacterium RIFCSPLOWO2_01_FULL_33_17]
MKNIFLHIEDRARKYFEQFPFTHALLAGIGVILFWRGVWEIADINRLSPIASVIIGIILLGGIGLFVHTFVGNAIIIKSIKHEIDIEKENKAEVTQVEKDIKRDEITLDHLSNKLDSLIKKIDHIEKHLQ